MIFRTNITTIVPSIIEGCSHIGHKARHLRRRDQPDHGLNMSARRMRSIRFQIQLRARMALPHQPLQDGGLVGPQESNNLPLPSNKNQLHHKKHSDTVSRYTQVLVKADLFTKDFI